METLSAIAHHFLPAVNPVIYFFLLFGLTGVGAAFIVGLPAVGQLLAILWTAIFGEAAFAKMRGQEPGSDLHID